MRAIAHGFVLMVAGLATLQSPASAQFTEKRLTFEFTDDSPAWSPDGLTIWFDSQRGTSLDLWTVPAAGGSVAQITFNLNADQNPAFSPDGSNVVYAASAGSGLDLYIRPAAGGAAVLLDADALNADRHPSWSPDSLLIAYEKGSDIYLIPSAGGTPTQLTFDPASDGHPSWSPDGSQIVFRSDRSGNGDIWVIPSSGGTPTQLTTDAANDAGPDWHPTGDLIAFHSTRTGTADLWVVPAAGGTETQITFGLFGDDFRPDWSPDGRSVVFSRAGSIYTVAFPVADVSVTKVVDNTGPNEGGTVVFTVAVTNDGLDTATGVQLQDNTPVGLTFVSSTATSGTYDDVSGIWSGVDSLVTSGSDTLRITCTVDSGTAGQNIRNTARLIALDQFDADTADDDGIADLDVASSAVSADLGQAAPATFSLSAGRPNPFRRRTNVSFDVPVPGRVELEVFDVSGRRVKTLVRSDFAPGRFEAGWDGRDETGRMGPAGVYFVRLRAGSFEATRRVVRLR